MAIPFEEVGALAKAAQEAVTEGPGFNLLDALGGATRTSDAAATLGSHLESNQTSAAALLDQYRNTFGVSFDRTPSNSLLITNVGQTTVRFHGLMPSGQAEVRWIVPGEQHLLAIGDGTREVAGSLSPLGSRLALKFAVPPDSAEVGFHVSELPAPTTLPVLPMSTIYGRAGSTSRYMAGLVQSRAYGATEATTDGWKLAKPQPAAHGLKFADDPPLLTGLRGNVGLPAHGRELTPPRVADHGLKTPDTDKPDDPPLLTGLRTVQPSGVVGFSASGRELTTPRVADHGLETPDTDKPNVPRPAHSTTTTIRTPGDASGGTNEKILPNLSW